MNTASPRRLVIGISGASGNGYACCACFIEIDGQCIRRGSQQINAAKADITGQTAQLRTQTVELLRRRQTFGGAAATRGQGDAAQLL